MNQSISEYKVYDTIELLYTNDKFTELKAGDQGIITGITYFEGFEQIWVNWFNGSSLALLSDIDKFKVITN